MSTCGAFSSPSNRPTFCPRNHPLKNVRFRGRWSLGDAVDADVGGRGEEEDAGTVRIALHCLRSGTHGRRTHDSSKKFKKRNCFNAIRTASVMVALRARLQASAPLVVVAFAHALPTFLLLVSVSPCSEACSGTFPSPSPHTAPLSGERVTGGGKKRKKSKHRKKKEGSGRNEVQQ